MCIILFVGAVCAEETVFWDDFDTVKPDWDTSHSSVSYTIQDGFVVLNLSANGSITYPHFCAIRLTQLMRCAGLEMRLRNLGHLEGGRHWGFHSSQEDLKFIWLSNESAQDFQGLHTASVVNGKYRFNDLITGIDITDWHNYTIIWEKDNGTFP